MFLIKNIFHKSSYLCSNHVKSLCHSQEIEKDKAKLDAKNSLRGVWEIMGREVRLHKVDAEVMSTALLHRNFGWSLFVLHFSDLFYSSSIHSLGSELWH